MSASTPHPAAPTVSAALRRYRLGLLAGGIVWVLVASTLCGCSRSHAWVMNQSGRAYFRQGNYEAARGEFERALMDNPYRASYAYNVAKVLEVQGDTTGAEQMYQHALTLNPSHRQSYRALSTMLVREGRNGEARDLLTAWSATQPYVAAANVELAEVEKSVGNFAGAEQQLALALQKRPGYGKARREMRELLRETGRGDLASNLMYYRQLTNNAYYQALQSQGLSGIAPSQHMAAYMPQYDSRIKGGVIQDTYRPSGFGFGTQGFPMNSPMPMGVPMEMSPMMEPGTTITPMPAPGEMGTPVAPGLPSPGAHMPMPMSGHMVQGQMVPGPVVHGTMMPGAPAYSTQYPGLFPQGSPMPQQHVEFSPMPTTPMPSVSTGPVHVQEHAHQPVPTPYPTTPNGIVPGAIPLQPMQQPTPVPAQHPVELGTPVPVTQQPGVGLNPTVISGTPSVPAF